MYYRESESLGAASKLSQAQKYVSHIQDEALARLESSGTDYDALLEKYR